MAVFGLPGGAEWLIIAITLLLLFVPSLGLVALGFFLGRRSVPSALPPEEKPEPSQPEDEDA